MAIGEGRGDGLGEGKRGDKSRKREGGQGEVMGIGEEEERDYKRKREGTKRR